METQVKDKRVYKRYEYQAPIVYEYGNTNNYYDAKLVNIFSSNLHSFKNKDHLWFKF